jgi:hypothetical protein
MRIIQYWWDGCFTANKHSKAISAKLRFNITLCGLLITLLQQAVMLRAYILFWDPYEIAAHSCDRLTDLALILMRVDQEYEGYIKFDLVYDRNPV